MHLHFTIYKYISKVFFSKAYYINTEMADRFPYFQSEFISKVIKFLNPINKLKHIYLINVISLFGNYLAFFFFFFFNIIYIIFDKFIKIVYYIFIAKIKLFKTVYQNNLSYYKIFWLFFFCYIFLSLYMYGLLYYIILFYFFIAILSLCFNKWLWFLGFLFCFFLDIINIILSKMVNIFIKVFKFLFIYPFFLFLFLFFFYNNSVLSFYFFDFIQIHLIYIYECMYVILNNLIDYYTIVYLPVNYNIFFNKLQTIYNNYNLAKEEYNNIDWNLLSILREKELLPKVKGEFVIFVIFDSIDYIYNIFDYVWDNFIKNIKITIKYFYYYLMVKSIYLFNSIFWSYKFLMDYRKDQFAFIMINIYFDTYIELIKIFIYNKILIDLPYFIIQPILNFIITIYEYSITFKYLLNIMANIKYISIIFYTIIEGLNIYICNIFSTFIYSTLFIAKISYWFCDIFFYFIIDIIFNLNGYFLIDWLYLYTNIDFLFYNIYSKFINFKDGIFSWFRFPIKNSVLLNKKFLLFQHFESFYYIEEFIFEWTNETNVSKTDGSLFFSDRYSEMPFWLQLLQYKPTNFIAFSYKIHKFYKAFSSFPFLWFFFWFYYIYIYLILIIFLFNIYSKLFKDNNELYKSNIHNWDLIRENAINYNFSWYKKNTNLNYYYYKEIIKTKEIRAIKKNDNFMIDKNLMSDDKIIELNRIKMNNKNIFSLKKMLKKKKINYLIFFKKYNMFKNKIEKFRKIKNKKLKFKKIYYKFLNFYKNIKSFKNFNKNITFNFKNFMINNKFNILYNFFLIEKKKFNLFSLYYYKKNKHIPFIYEHWFEENFAEGPIIFNINEKDYIYLKNTLFNLFQFFKWFDNSFFNKKGSIYFFHKDPTVCYVGNDKFNIKYYFNSSLDSDSYNTNNVAIIFFIFFPIFIIINLLLSDMLHIEHVDEDSFFYVFGEYIFYWLCWFFIQFEYLHDSLITFMFGSLECRLNNIEPHYDSAYGVQPTWFHYDKMVKKFFPLYSYYKSKILLYQVFDSRENSSLFNDIWKFFETLYFYICNVYDIVYIKFNILNFYSSKIFFYFIFKIIIYIYIIVIIYYNRNFKIFKFFLYSKKNLNMLNFMNKLLNNKVNNLKKIWNKNL
jgi:hypothetical protein